MRKVGSLGPTAQKVLLLLLAGPAFILAYSPKRQFRVLKELAVEWGKIDRRALDNAVRSLYINKMVDIKENRDGAITIVLTSSGKNKALTYDLENMEIPVMKKWDKKWRVILFDIPEKHKKARRALSQTLKNIGCFQFQKSVFVHPFECRNEIDFVIEFFSMRQYVRFIIADNIDNELDLKRRFGLLPYK
ncbi:MAG: hypothetical protein Q8Q46_03480 [Candidatus Giovannonibacteria bacterium]|nr:hypothetical protein [Candidatus Giovannonibacteria bacterium]